MSSTPQHRAELFVMMQLRRLSLGHNLLRRRVDRIEAAFLLVAIAIALLVVPAAAALGTTLHDRAEQSATEERASLHQVRARTLEGTANAVPSTLGLSTTSVRVRWQDPSGSPHEGKADVLLGTPVNAEVTIWIDQAGAMTGAPATSADSDALGTAIALTLPLLAWPAIFAAFRLARRPLDRYRADEWAREWRKVSPRWTGRQS
ncbi:Rv1733c family protein [Kribbella sp. CA-245084]|uniref:Rv1733c family protein n=1 Tax=Kribbella sp. CA-245084 TaxID=3239940 RepID=UPI003D8FF59D